MLLACLLGIVLVTSEYQHQTATTTFLLTPRRTPVITAKLLTGVLLAAAAWLLSTVISVVAGTIFLHTGGYGTQLGHGGVLSAVLLNLAAYLLWAVFGVGVGALVRHQLGATVGVTVLYLVGATAASSVFALLNTYVLQQDWVLAAQVVVPTVASAVMISPTATFDQSPPQRVGAAVLLAYGMVLGALECGRCGAATSRDQPRRAVHPPLRTTRIRRTVMTITSPHRPATDVPLPSVADAARLGTRPLDKLREQVQKRPRRRRRDALIMTTATLLGLWFGLAAPSVFPVTPPGPDPSVVSVAAGPVAVVPAVPPAPVDPAVPVDPAHPVVPTPQDTGRADPAGRDAGGPGGFDGGGRR